MLQLSDEGLTLTPKSLFYRNKRRTHPSIHHMAIPLRYGRYDSLARFLSGKFVVINIKKMEVEIDNHSNLGSAKIFSVLWLGNSHELNPRFSNALPSPISARYPYMVSGMNVWYRVCYVICIFVLGYRYVHYSVSTRYSQISYSISTR